MKRIVTVIFLSAVLLFPGFLSISDQLDWPNIYIDASAGEGGVGSRADPYNEFSDINWTTGGENSVFDAVAANLDVTINLKKGETWREQLTLGESGKSGHPITIQAYSVGEDPFISGADLVTTWESYSSDVATNGSFETFTGTEDEENTDDFAGWTEIPANGGTIKAVNVAEADLSSVPNGVFAVGMKAAAIGTHTLVTTFTLGAGTSVDLSFQGISDGVGHSRIAIYHGGAYLHDDLTWGVTDWEITALNVSTGNTSWTEKRIVFISDTEATYTMRVENLNNHGNVYLDNLIITEINPNVWYAALATEPDRIDFNGMAGTDEVSIRALNEENEWFWESNVLYVYSASDPDKAYVAPGIEAYVRDVCVYGAAKDYITIDGLHLVGFNDRGIFILGGTYVIIQNCTISGGSSKTRAFGIQYQGNNTLRTGIEIKDNTIGTISTAVNEGIKYGGIAIQDVTGAIISGNTLNTTHTTSIKLFAGGGGDNQNCTIENNEIYGCRGGIFNNNADGSIIRDNKIHDGLGLGVGVAYDSDNTQVYHNLIYNLGKGTNTWNGIDVNHDSQTGVVYNNAIYKVYGNCFVIDDSTAACDGWIIRNNIFDASQNTGDDITIYALCWRLNEQSLSWTSDYNFCFPKKQTLGGVENPTHYDAEAATFFTLADWTVAYSQEANSISADLLMTDPGSDDFSLQAASPCIHKGTDISLIIDYK